MKSPLVYVNCKGQKPDGTPCRTPANRTGYCPSHRNQVPSSARPAHGADTPINAKAAADTRGLQ